MWFVELGFVDLCYEQEGVGQCECDFQGLLMGVGGVFVDFMVVVVIVCYCGIFLVWFCLYSCRVIGGFSCCCQ